MNKAVNFVLDLFFPNKCPICKNFIGYDEFVCEMCIDDLEKYIPENTDNSLQMNGVSFDKMLAGFYYENIVRDGIYSLKDGHKEFGYYLGNILAGMIKSDEMVSHADCIVAVPMSARSFKKRGYNQAEVIAETISAATGIKMMTDILYKHESEIQHSLNMTQRMENVRAYNIKNTDLSGMKIIICDDVCTTGSTINRCAELLKSMGAAEVFAAVGTTTKLKKE